MKSTVMLTARIDRPLVVAITQVAKRRKMTRTELIRQALLKAVKDAA